ncbi:MAG: hypothetical protein COT43_00750 [Candidatus Marinimicrobia bacterium CG08_land_8_20_14_0_20_45_22]|nr:MAG: hypothetical protein COT43_00750 [Candidatus Marinimicrobia bacterium CG08_land_8_20_14_0_20_45_22]
MIRSWMTTLTVFCLTSALFGASENFYGNVTIESKPVYSLTGRYTKKNGLAIKTTDYFTASGQWIVSEKVRYKNDSFDLIGYTIHDSRSGRHEEIVRKNIDTILRQNQITFKLLVPERMMVVDFQIQHIGSKIVNVTDCYEFQMEPTVMVLKPLVKPMYFHYEKRVTHKI